MLHAAERPGRKTQWRVHFSEARALAELIAVARMRRHPLRRLHRGGFAAHDSYGLAWLQSNDASAAVGRRVLLGGRARAGTTCAKMQFV